MRFFILVLGLLMSSWFPYRSMGFSTGHRSISSLTWLRHWTKSAMSSRHCRRSALETPASSAGIHHGYTMDTAANQKRHGVLVKTSTTLRTSWICIFSKSSSFWNMSIKSWCTSVWWCLVYDVERIVLFALPRYDNSRPSMAIGATAVATRPMTLDRPVLMRSFPPGDPVVQGGICRKPNIHFKYFPVFSSKISKLFALSFSFILLTNVQGKHYMMIDIDILQTVHHSDKHRAWGNLENQLTACSPLLPSCMLTSGSQIWASDVSAPWTWAATVLPPAVQVWPPQERNWGNWGAKCS